jgi:hypothetical protein
VTVRQLLKELTITEKAMSPNRDNPYPSTGIVKNFASGCRCRQLTIPQGHSGQTEKGLLAIESDGIIIEQNEEKFVTKGRQFHQYY